MSDELKKLTATIEAMRKEQGAMRKEINKKLDEKIDALQESIDGKFDECTSRITAVEERVSGLEKRLDTQTEGNHRVCNLVVSGLPYKDGENIATIFKVIYSKLGYIDPPLCNIYRVPGADANRNIILRFPTEFHKMQFLPAFYKVAKEFKRSIFPGFPNDQERVYLQHDFTQHQYKIHKTAMAFRNSKEVFQIRVGAGNVISVKFKDGERFKVIASPEVLEKECNARKTTLE
jgi:hypothetical protein